MTAMALFFNIQFYRYRTLNLMVLKGTSNTSGHINNLFFAGNKDALPTSDTAQYNGTATGFEITNISATGVTMSADIKAQ